MKKNFLILLFGTLAVSFIQARSIAPPEARMAAEYAVDKYSPADVFTIERGYLPLADDAGRILLYIFSIDPAGFVAVTSESELPPVIYYTFAQNFIDEGYGSRLKDFLLSDVNRRLEQLPLLPKEMIEERETFWEKIIHEGPVERYFEQWPPEGTTPTGGWLMENWHQNGPYNMYCPMDPVTANRSVAGCPATAMAMIVNYFENLNNTQFDDDDDYYHNYAGRTYWIDDDYKEIEFLSFPEINSYFDTILIHWAGNEPLQDEEKAALTFACGVSAQQVYTSQVSGTFGVNQAYDAYLRFGFTQCELLDETDTTIYSKLSQNMKDAVPAHLAVVDPGWTMGHNVVLDGYNTDDFYHINFGWGGSYNGWYLIPEEIPYGLTVIEGVVLNIFDLGTGLREELHSGSVSLKVYPNPASGFLNVDLSGIDGKATVHVIDSHGRLVDQVVGESGIGRIRIDLHRYTSGVYHCIVRSDRIIKQAAFIVVSSYMHSSWPHN